MTQVLIVDDQRSIRFGLGALVETAPDLVLCGAADSGESAVQLASELRPDVVVMDLSMPGMGGLAATRRIRETCPESHVLVLTWYADAERVRLAFDAGATGYVLKGDYEIDVLESIREVARHQRSVSAAIAHF